MSFIEEKVAKYTKSNDALDKRRFFFMYRETLLPYYLTFIQRLNELQERKLIYYVIKGSSAWFINLMAGQKSASNSQELLDRTVDMIGDEIDAFAFLPQNWDITVFADHSNMDLAFQELSKIFKDVVKMMKNIPKLFTYENKRLDRIEAFRGYYLALCTGARKTTRLTTEDMMKKYEKFGDYVCQSINGFFFIWMNLIPLTNLQNTTEKLFSHISAEYPADMLSATSNTKATFLNENGLLLFSSILKSSDVNRVHEKGFDIDKIRNNWISESIKKNGGNIVRNYFNLIGRWTHTFKNDIGDPMFTDKYQYRNILYTLQTELLSSLVLNGKNRYDVIENTLIEVFRPVINVIVIELNSKFSEYRHPAIERIDACIVGGDAFTRYIEQSGTSDIDIKVIVIPKNNVNAIWMPNDVWIDVQNIMTSVLSKYVVYLSYIYMSSNVSFRLRDIDVIEDKKRNFYLYSIDIRTVHNINVNQLGNLEGYRHELALFDAAIIFDKNRHYGDMTTIIYVQPKITPNFQEYYIALPTTKYNTYPTLPISSRQFLMADIEETYSSSLAKIRIAKGKANKDIVRYNALSGSNIVIGKNNVIDLYITSTLLNLRKDGVSSTKLLNLVKIYSAIHNQNIKEKKLIGKRKYQTPFNIAESNACSVNPEIKTICRSFTEPIPELSVLDCESRKFKEIIASLDSSVSYRCMNISPALFNV